VNPPGPAYSGSVRRLTTLRAEVIVLLGVLTMATGGLAASWQPATGGFGQSALMAVAAISLAGAVLTLLAQSGWLAIGLTAGPLLQRAAALRRKSDAAVFQRQLNPDAAGHARPRAPSAAPAAA
jgi:hypothetical protein